MYSYKIRGDGYDSIAVDVDSLRGTLRTRQFYIAQGQGAIRVTEIYYKLESIEGKTTLVGIDTTDTDTVILPRQYINQLGAFCLAKTEFSRLVIPPSTTLHLCSKALYGSKHLKEFVCLSRDITNSVDAFPAELKRRLV